MGFPTIPSISINRNQAVNLLLASVAFEELGLAHIINAEGEKLQAALGTLPGLSVTARSFEGLLTIDRDVRRTLRTIIDKEILLQFQMEDIGDMSQSGSGPSFVEIGSAWGVGTRYDDDRSNAQYFTIASDATADVTTNLGLGRNNINVGSVTAHLHTSGTTKYLDVTFKTTAPLLMSQAQLLVSDAVPTITAPGLFPYKFVAATPVDDFDTHTFSNIDVTSITGTIYIAAHANIVELV